jgi:hypothetical protein
MIYLVMACRPSLDSRRFEVRRIKVYGVLPSSIIAKGLREAGFAVTVLKPLSSE